MLSLSSFLSILFLFDYFLIYAAIRQVVIDHADSLHKGIDNGRTHKFEA